MSVAIPVYLNLTFGMLRLIPLDLGVRLCCRAHIKLQHRLSLVAIPDSLQKIGRSEWRPWRFEWNVFWSVDAPITGSGSKMGGESTLWKAQIGGVWRYHHLRIFLNKSRIKQIGEIIGNCHCWIEWKRSVISYNSYNHIWQQVAASLVQVVRW